jgi:hypothetical protein
MSEVRGLAWVGVGIILVSLLPTGASAAGQTAGVGLFLADQDGWPTILYVTEGAPAARAGLRSGDRIAKINGQSTRAVPPSEVVQRLTGPAGEKVTVTIHRPEGGKITEFDVTLTREVVRARMPTVPVLTGLSLPTYTPTKEAQKVEWRGNKIVSRVLPYPDLLSLLIRLPLAHAVATGQGVHVALVQRCPGDGISSVLKYVAPHATIHEYTLAPQDADVAPLAAKIREAGCRVAVILDVDLWSQRDIVSLSDAMLPDKFLLIVPSDLSEDPNKIDIINALPPLGVLTVGRLNNQSIVMRLMPDDTKPFNRRIRTIRTDVLSTVDSQPYPDARTPAVTAAGIAALVLERRPNLSSAEVRRKIIDGARAVWQGTSPETGQWSECSVDPVTTKYTPVDEKTVFRFKVLDAAAALDVDTEVPWFLNMLNCPRAWEITKGEGAVVLVTDSGFHLRHPELMGHIETPRHLGPQDFNNPNQHFHGTEMSRLVLAVAPEAKIIPVLCSDPDMEQLIANVARSFALAVEQKADVISSSWPGQFNKNAEFLAAVRRAADQGVVVSWFHYREPYPGILRPYFAYGYWSTEPRLGFSDRFLINPPTFHPVEIESGLSNTAPQAAGLAALVKSVNPVLTPREVEKLIFDNSDLVGKVIRIPDAYRLVQAARGRPASG